MSLRPLIVAAVLCLCRAGLAAEPAPGQTGIFLGVRAGYAVPGGKVQSSEDGSGNNLSDGFTGLIPFALELGYRVIPHLSVGATLQYGFGLINDQPGNGCANCSGHVISFGANAYLHAAPDGAFDPWVGLGVGYESLRISGSELAPGGGSAATFDGTLTGIQFLNVQLGGDFAASPLLSVGPFFGVSFGRYSSASETFNLGGQSRTMSADLKNTAVHEWFMFGLRGRFNL